MNDHRDVELVLLRGLPASGKTTIARKWARAETRRVALSEHAVRRLLFEDRPSRTPSQDGLVLETYMSTAHDLLKRGASVAIDDLRSLDRDRATAWADTAQALGVALSVVDLQTDVEECVRRDREREARGELGHGEGFIRTAARTWGAPEQWPAVEPSRGAVDDMPVPAAYRHAPGLPWVWLLDIDGSLAHNDGHRGWYGEDELKVGDDKPIEAVVRVAKALIDAGDAVKYMTGRSEYCRAQTLGWLRKWVDDRAEDKDLLMRAEDDVRADAVIKEELFEKNIAGRFNVHGVVDDRPQVCRLWKAKGLHLFDVNQRGREF